jgi:hypothetical protein
VLVAEEPTRFTLELGDGIAGVARQQRGLHPRERLGQRAVLTGSGRRRRPP